MTTPLLNDEWLAANGAYLSAALAWLRLILQRQAQAVSAGKAPPPPSGSFTQFFRRGGSQVFDAPGKVTSSAVDRAAEAMEQAARIDPPPALLSLAENLKMAPFERDVLLLCAALDLDTRIGALCALAQGDPARPYPTFALAMTLFAEPRWEAVSPHGPLRYWRLIEIHQAGAQPLTTSPLRADERIINHLKGQNYLDDRLAPLLVPFDLPPGPPEPLPASQQALVRAIIRRLDGTGGRAPILQLVGSDSLSKQLVALEALKERAALARLPLEMLPAQPAELESLARLWQRESMLLPLALYLDAHAGSGATAAGEGQPSPLHRLLARDLGLVLLDTRAIEPGLGPYSLPIDIDKPAPVEQQAAWIQALGPQSEAAAAQLAAQFNLNLPTIRQVARSVRAGLPQGETPPPETVWQACLEQTRPRLDKLAQRLEPKATWGEIVLPAEPLALLRQIAAQVRQRSKVYDEWGFRQKMNRGLGITALFSGESGTGKTMAAEVIANELKLNLYRIDLSAVVSKYIGETEKNLRQVFDAAEDGGAILFFDEADALFGKRSEVKDSHDRYANIEINYLLQRMEAYRGLAILATNMKSALDQAFLRRLRFIVVFPFPDQANRRLIWERVFPVQGEGQTPIVEWLDYDFLARLPLTGGSIHNTALNAAFLAAQAGTPVTMPWILAAALGELRKLERPTSQASFRPPPEVEARRATWLGLLAEAEAQPGQAVTFDYERLAWWGLDDVQLPRLADLAARQAREAGRPLTMGLLVAAARELRSPERVGPGPEPAAQPGNRGSKEAAG